MSDLQTARAQLQAQLETLRGSLGVEHSKQLRELEAKNLATMQETMAESKKASDKRLGLLQQKHQAALEDLKEAHEVTLQKAAEDAEARLKKELAAARAETQKLLTLLEKDKAVRFCEHVWFVSMFGVVTLHMVYEPVGTECNQAFAAFFISTSYWTVVWIGLVPMDWCQWIVAHAVRRRWKSWQSSMRTNCKVPP